MRMFGATFVALLFLVPATSASACNETDAIANTIWVLDGGGQGCYGEARRCQRHYDASQKKWVTSGGCKGSYDAVLYCQRHNSGVQNRIKACESQVRAYLARRGH